MKYLTKLNKAEYLGSHPSLTGQIKKVTVEFYDIGIRLTVRSELLAEIPWTRISALEADDRDHIETRVTVSRLLVLGVFALAVPKKRAGSFLVIEATDGTYVLFIPGLHAVELGAGLGPLRQYVAGSRPGPAPSTPALPTALTLPAEDVAERLAKLEHLREHALITDAEYAQKRSEILDLI